MNRLFFAAFALLSVSVCEAQMINTTVPFNNWNSSYFESSGVQWSLRGPNWFANSGGGPLLPPFGQPDPNAGARTGVAFGGGGVSGSLGLQLSQGSSRTMTTSAPSVTTMDGFPGAFASGVIRPFVVGSTPIVGNYEGALAPLNQANQTGAAIQSQQINSLLKSQAVLANRKLEQYLYRATRAESGGNKRMARANYRSAIAIAPEPLKTQLRARLKWVMSQP
ncbi:MAG: hypothetical protein AAGG48_07025 [Planctomycetota bacterium]